MADNIVTVMDTTLRDGEQTNGVSFTAAEKLSIAKLLLEDLKIDRIEVASARVSEGEYEGVRKIIAWAREHGFIDKVEVLGFVDGKASLDWINNAGCKVINLLTKGSLNHVTNQLRKTPEEHLSDIKKSVAYAQELGITVNMYMEDWSNGMRNSPEYVEFILDGLKDEPIAHFMLPDTLGILNHRETFEYLDRIIKKYPGYQFDYHSHNDYDLATANTFEALYAGIRCVHTTVNGLGERAGNVPLSSVIGIVHDHLGLKMNVQEDQLYKVSKLVESFSGIRIPPNKPLIGEHVFTQTSGIHADGDSKQNLYFNDLMPERFGRKRIYALGKTSGKANIRKNLEDLGIELDADDMKKVTERVIELGDKKEVVTPEDLPYIISDVLRSESIKEDIQILNYTFSTTKGLTPVATLLIRVNGHEYEQTSVGDGQYDAFVKALRIIYKKLNKEFPKLNDYVVSIPPGGKTDALVQSTITWEYEGREYKTRGLDSDQTVAAVIATVKILNIIESKHMP